ncbi:ROK family protein [Flavihumibacter rivuli]|uniref:ROK family transcriptional regulator n=1 Tax=Flavihumibacter rivuli TaxID=2838156 RepID=UPI001BDEC3C5|nr:ROK family transcriptional regulator [Flavihumibacter rivuli]ULQ55769.1 ROK family protein [Flavihumibacter rivuli]
MVGANTLLTLFSDDTITGVAHKNKALKRQIMQLLDRKGHSTITDLAQEFTISVPKMTSLISELIDSGIVQDYGKTETLGGRKPYLYGLNAKAAYFLGVDVKKDYINIGLMNFNKELVSVRERIPYNLENSQEALQNLIAIIRKFIDDFPQYKNDLLALGVNLSGRINHTNGFSFSYFHFQEEPLTVVLEKQLGIRTFLENDARANTYGEIMNMSTERDKNILYIFLDHGIGMGMYINGNLYYGKSGYSGELGHIPIFDNERICHCGKKGCLETEASGSALQKAFKEKLLSGSTSLILDKVKTIESIRLRHIIEAANNDDVLSIELIGHIGEKIGRAIAIVINIFNPDLVILGGTLAETGEILRLPVKSALSKYSLSLVNSDSQLKTSVLGEKAGYIGACLIARNKLIQMV